MMLGRGEALEQGLQQEKLGAHALSQPLVGYWVHLCHSTMIALFVADKYRCV